MGNSGSATTGSHFADDFAAATMFENGKQFRVFSFTDHTAFVLALSNNLQKMKINEGSKDG